MNSKERRIPSREIVVLAGLLVLALAVRLIKISQPYVDEWSFKQGTIAMIAENFYRNGFNIFYPQINWAGNAAGYIGTEFPLVPFLASLLYIPFGVQEWIGRSVSVTFSVLALPFFYFLVKKVSNEHSAAFAGVIYAVAPLSIFASRSFISDMTSLGFSIAALYLFSEWLDRSNDRRLLLSAAAATTLAILVKAPTAIIALPLAYMAWEQYRWKFIRQPKIWVFACLSMAFPIAWYTHAYFLTMTYPPHQFMGSDGLRLEDLHFDASVGRRLVGSSLTPVVAVGTLAGLFLPPATKYGGCFIGGSLLFASLSSPPASETVILGINFPSCLWRRPSPGGRLIFCCTGCAHSLHREPPSISAAPCCVSRSLPFLMCTSSRFMSRGLRRYERPEISSTGLLLRTRLRSSWWMAIRRGSTTADEKGGTPSMIATGCPLDSAQAIMELEKLRNRGATHLVFTLYTVWWLDYYKEFADYLDSYYRRVSETEDYVIFDLADGLNKTATAGGSPSFRVDPSQD